MPKLFSSQDKKFLNQIEKTERDLNKFICNNWENLFPQYKLIKSEFKLIGNVRSIGTDGRIDILAYNPTTQKFVIFELKKNYDKNITDQVADYRDYIQDNFENTYIRTIQDYNINLPKYDEISHDQVEIILIAKKFSITQLDRVKKLNKKDNNITLIKYFWFENNLIFIDYINNDPDEIKQEAENTKKIKHIQNIILEDPATFEINQYFGLYNDSKNVFLYFLNFLKSKGNVVFIAQQSKMKVTFNEKITFSIIKLGGKTGRKAIIQLNTNINVMVLLNKNLIIDDRLREDGSKKGSLGTERYEVFLRNINEMEIFCDFISSII